MYAGIEVMSSKWMDLACEEATRSVSQSGGPFGAVIVQVDDTTREVLRYWVQHNYVPITKDPTAHAEMCALGTYDLGRILKSESALPQKGRTSHCELYSSSEPCPMCCSGIYWAGIPALYFAATRYDAAQQGVDFPDEQLYLDINRPYQLRSIKCRQCTTGNSLDAFNLWKNSPHTSY
jgi:guanine deaminase